jgi:hypothetical protein
MESGQAQFDVVYTWVDDAFPGFREARAKYARTRQDSDPRRTRDNLELLKYSLRALTRFAPWRGTIHIVTCSPQVPSWLDTTRPGLRMVYHEEIMPADLLPSFNAFAIESFLHLIPGLSNRFVHFNDDMLLFAPAPRDLFETEDGKLKLYFRGELPPAETPINESHFPHSSGRIHCARALDRLFGKGPYLEQAHHPRIVDGQEMEKLIATFPEEFARTRAARFRGHDTILPHKLLASYMVESGNAMAIGPKETACLMRYEGASNSALRNRWRLWLTQRAHPTFLCLNDAFGSGDAAAAGEKVVRDFLEKAYPEPSPFERA